MTDPRIAKAAAAHRGMAYVKPAGRIPTWSPEIAYALGLTATDGCLVRDGRHIAFVTKDEDLMQTWLRCLAHSEQRYRKSLSSAGTPVYRVQLSDAGLYRWLMARGLTPRKSLTLGAVEVPRGLLGHLIRGLLDGDGSIYVARHRPTKNLYPNYWYTRLWTFFTSASASHVSWLRESIRAQYGLNGFVETTRRPGRNDFYRLKYGKNESLRLLEALYSDPAAPHLARKRKKWLDYLSENCAEGGI